MVAEKGIPDMRQQHPSDSAATSDRRRADGAATSAVATSSRRRAADGAATSDIACAYQIETLLRMRKTNADRPRICFPQKGVKEFLSPFLAETTPTAGKDRCRNMGGLVIV